MTRRVSRRGAVGSVLAGVGLLVGAEAGVPSRRDEVRTDLVAVEVGSVPVSRLVADVAVAAHPTFRTTVYADVDAWVQRLVALGVRRFRGVYDPANPGTAAAVEACRRHGVGWIMLVVPEADLVPTTQSLQTTRDVVRQVARDCSDVCAGLEGLNEPNHNRGTDVPPPASWAAGWAAPHQRVIWETARAEPSLAGVEVIGPSLHDASARASYRGGQVPGGAEQYHQLAEAGVGRWQDRLGLHSYPDGGLPLAGLDDRLAVVRDAFGDGVAVHVTETGYVTALDLPRGQGPGPVSEEAMALYLVRAALQYGSRGLPWVWYELLDDPDAGAKDVVQANYGLWRVGETDPASWDRKPAARALRALVERLAGAGAVQAGPSVPPAPGAPTSGAASVGVRAPAGSSVVCVVSTGGVSGDVAHLFRDVAVFDPDARRRLQPASVEVELVQGSDRRTLRVGPEVLSVPLG